MNNPPDFPANSMPAVVKAARWYFWFLAVLRGVQGLTTYINLSQSFLFEDSPYFPIMIASGTLVFVLVLCWLGWGIGSRKKSNYYVVAMIYLVFFIVSRLIDIVRVASIDGIMLIAHFGLLGLLLATRKSYFQNRGSNLG